MGNLDPIRRDNFGLAPHRYRQFDATVDRCMVQNELESSDLWVNLAGQIQPGDEIRVRSFDDSFVARLYVTYVNGSRVIAKVVHYVELEPVDYKEMGDGEHFYEAKLRGPKKWCVIEKASGTIIKELIPTQLEAMREMSDLERALGR